MDKWVLQKQLLCCFTHPGLWVSPQTLLTCERLPNSFPSGSLVMVHEKRKLLSELKSLVFSTTMHMSIWGPLVRSNDIDRQSEWGTMLRHQ